ncbi:hypothetical protein EI94DRAFT_1704338 [Lactarius quietus]|nr:hypothetical protein EI94DRAFT_1704338 [Lactarius quietus]
MVVQSLAYTCSAAESVEVGSQFHESPPPCMLLQDPKMLLIPTKNAAVISGGRQSLHAAGIIMVKVGAFNNCAMLYREIGVPHKNKGWYPVLLPTEKKDCPQSSEDIQLCTMEHRCTSWGISACRSQQQPDLRPVRGKSKKQASAKLWRQTHWRTQGGMGGQSSFATWVENAWELQGGCNIECWTPQGYWGGCRGTTED